MKMIMILFCAALTWNLHADEPTETEAIVRAVEATTGWTAEELKAGLDRLDRLYQSDMKSKDGRKRWHGAVVTTEFDTNRLVKVETHESGFRHEEKFTPRVVDPVEKQLSSIEKKKRAEELRKRRLEQLEKSEKAKLAELMKKYPEELAKQKIELEKSALMDPVEVSVEITPQN